MSKVYFVRGQDADRLRCEEMYTDVLKSFHRTFQVLRASRKQSTKSKVDGEELYLPLTIELRVRQDGGHNGCSMPRRVAVHGPDDLHVHQALIKDYLYRFITCNIMLTGMQATALQRHDSACMQVVAGRQSAAGGQSTAVSCFKPQTAAKMPTLCSRSMTCAPKHKNFHRVCVKISAEGTHQQTLGEKRIAAQICLTVNLSDATQTKVLFINWQ